MTRSIRQISGNKLDTRLSCILINEGDIRVTVGSLRVPRVIFGVLRDEKGTSK